MRYLVLLLCPTLLFAVEVGDQITISESPPATWEHPYHGQSGTVTNLGLNGLSIDFDGDGLRESGGGVTYSSEGDTWNVTGSGTSPGGGDSNTTVVVVVDGSNVTIDITATIDNEVTNVILNAIQAQLNNLDSDDDFLALNALLTELELLNLNQLQATDLDDIDGWLENIDQNIQSVIDKNESARILQSVDFIKASIADIGFDTDNDTPLLGEIRDKLNGELDVNFPSLQIVDVNLTSNLYQKLLDMRNLMHQMDLKLATIKSTATDLDKEVRELGDYIDPTDGQYGESLTKRFNELNMSITEEVEGMRGYFTDANGTYRLATLADLYQAIVLAADNNQTIGGEDDPDESDVENDANVQAIKGSIEDFSFTAPAGERGIVNGAAVGYIDFGEFLGDRAGMQTFTTIDLFAVGSTSERNMVDFQDVAIWIKRLIIIAVFWIYYRNLINSIIVPGFKLLTQSEESNSATGLAAPALKMAKVAIVTTGLAGIMVLLAGLTESEFFTDEFSGKMFQIIQAAINSIPEYGTWAATAFWLLTLFVPLATILGSVSTFYLQKFLVFVAILGMNRAARYFS